MRSHLLIASAAIAGVAAAVSLTGTAVSVASPAPATAARSGHGESFQIPFAGYHSQFVGADEKHPTAGDRSIDTFTVTSSGHHVGSGINACTVVQLHPTRAQCLATFLLPQGQLNALVSPANGGHGASTVLGIAGGTGRYSGAAGTVVITPGKTSLTLTIRY